MESQQAKEWFEVAQKVNSLLAHPFVRERFRERVEVAATEWLRRSSEKAEREEARREALTHLGVPYRSGRLPPDPRDGSFHWLETVPDPNSPGGRTPMEAWLPADLSPDQDPDDSLPLPVPAEREVSLAERYAVLAAVWDSRWKGGEKIAPWVDNEFSPEANWYWCLVHVDDLASSSAGLSNEDAAIVRAWVADVESDLVADRPTAANASRPAGRPAGRKKGTVAARMAELLLRDPLTTLSSSKFEGSRPKVI